MNGAKEAACCEGKSDCAESATCKGAADCTCADCAAKNEMGAPAIEANSVDTAAANR
jgi:hypothetical protein